MRSILQLLARTRLQTPDPIASVSLQERRWKEYQEQKRRLARVFAELAAQAESDPEFARLLRNVGVTEGLLKSATGFCRPLARRP